MSAHLFRSDALQARSALVTGGAGGIGAAIVRALSEAGAEVTFADRDEEAGFAMVQQTGAKFLHVDLSDLDAVRAALEARSDFDILVNNAGVDQHAFFSETTPADWRSLLRINLESVFQVTHTVLPGMQARGYGRIINIASEAGRQGSKGGAVYAAAKGGVLAFTKSIARENARYGITANVICPGPIRTALLEAAVKAHGGQKLEAAMAAATLLGRLGSPEDVASAAIFLASSQAGFITGEVLGVSGGMGC
jgi:2-hydroxycyclohexanecarboxyl-CoA dehydrogenase